MDDLITRRHALARAAYLLGGALAAPTIAGVLAGCERRAPGAAQAASALGADRKELVATLAEHILPETDTPGARSAGVQDFIDVMMSEYYPTEERDRFLAGLRRVDERAQRAFAKPFLQASPGQQQQIVEALNRRAFADPAAAPAAGAPVTREASNGTGSGEAEAAGTQPPAGALDGEWDPADVGRESFFRTLKELVLVGYYTSEPGATEELRTNPMGSWRGDVPFAAGTPAWA